eukprot:444876-Rhodomonas_salina.4
MAPPTSSSPACYDNPLSCLRADLDLARSQLSSPCQVTQSEASSSETGALAALIKVLPAPQRRVPGARGASQI